MDAVASQPPSSPASPATATPLSASRSTIPTGPSACRADQHPPDFRDKPASREFLPALPDLTDPVDPAVRPLRHDKHYHPAATTRVSRHLDRRSCKLPVSVCMPPSLELFEADGPHRSGTITRPHAHSRGDTTSSRPAPTRSPQAAIPGAELLDLPRHRARLTCEPSSTNARPARSRRLLARRVQHSLRTGANTSSTATATSPPATR